MRRIAPAVLLLAAGVAVTSPAWAQVRARGQIFLPSGQAIGAVTRFILTSEDSRRNPEIHFTDAQGRIAVQGLAAGQWYAITVESDGQTYATTVERFLAGPPPTGYVWVHLRPLEKLRKDPVSPTVSVNELGHRPPGQALDLYLDALRAIEKNDTEEAWKKLEQAVGLDPDYVDAYNELAVLALGQKKYEEAESLLRRALQADAAAPHPLLNLGITLNYLGRHAEAIDPLRLVLKLRPQWLPPHAYLGIALLETDQLTEAETHLRRAARADGREQVLAHLYLGKLYAQTGEAEKAAAAWNAYLKLDPDSPNAARVRELLARLGRPAPKP